MPKYILHYFSGNGRAVVPRAILCYAKADWVNSVVKMQDQAKIKKSDLCEFGQLSILEIGDKKYSQSTAINIYLGKTFKLMGKDIEDNYQIISLLMTYDDFTVPIYKWYFSQYYSKSSKLYKEAEEKLKFFIERFEKRYIDLGKGKYFLGDEFTLADIFLATVIPSVFDVMELKENYYKTNAPNLGELIKRVKENELKEFYEKYYV